MGYYHQDERDEAVGIGCAVFVVTFALVLAVFLINLVASIVCPAPNYQANTTEVMDGSSAGANAVTLEELQAQGIA